MILIRHLPTSFNIKGILQGRIDNSILHPLSDNSKKDINRNLKIIDQIIQNPIVLTSELIRTKQTADEYGFKKKIEISKLNELNFGYFDGKPKSSLIKTHPAWITNPRSLKLGEDLINFEKRLLSFINEFIKDHDNYIVFSHGAVIRALISINKFGDISRMNSFKVKNNELIDLKW